MIDQKKKIQKGLPFFIVIVLSCVVILALSWLGWGDYKVFKNSENQKQKELKAIELKQKILYFDEVLTMSARMASVSGDLKWEKRYNDFVPQLDEVIAEAIILAPESHTGGLAEQTNEANLKLIDMETKAFNYVRNGQTAQAEKLLFSDEYKNQKTLYFQGITNFSKTRNQALRLLELYGNIIHLDEVLTMSARMASVTGDTQWEERYNNFVPQLDDAIKEIIALSPGVYSGKLAEQTDNANKKLVEMERESFYLVRAGRKEKAYSVLFSAEYQEQKKIYSTGMEKFFAKLQEISDKRQQNQKNNTRRELFVILLIEIGIIFVLFMFLIFLRRWHVIRNKSEIETKKALHISEESQNKTEEALHLAEENQKKAEKAFLQAEESRKDSEEMNELMLGREEKMMELNVEIERLKKKCGEA